MVARAMDEVTIDEGGTAQVGTLLWWEDRERRMGRRRPRADGLTVERIIDAALAVIDHQGLETLTMRRLAEELATASASLYRHVSSRDELLVVVVDHVIGEVVLPPGELDGRRKVEWLAGELRRVLLAHPNLLAALTASPLVGPNARRGSERALESLIEAGYEPDVAVPAYLALIDFVLGAVSFDTSRAGRRTSDTIDRPSADAVFSFGLTTFLDGLELRRRAADGKGEQRSH
jgi:AcrR family transcriptional regulator